MKLLVAVSGAKTSCNQAVNPAARGEVIGTCDVDATGCEDSILTESDKGVPVNIKPLPTDCKILSSGCLFSKPTPCAPVVTTDWNNTSSGFGDTDENVLTENSFIMCNVGGQIDIEDPNQNEITVGIPLSEIFSDGKLTMEEVEQLFEYLAEQDITFDYPIDGCWNRAHLMVKAMEELGIPEESITKAWTFAKPGEELAVPANYFSMYSPDGIVNWGWHVAPVVTVIDDNGNEVQIALDPSIATEPVTVQEWVEISGNGNETDLITSPASAYALGQDGNLIYINNDDDDAMATELALEAMERYRLQKELDELWAEENEKGDGN